ncbi:MAG: formyltetrahydrofolate deformylase [Propionibacterium sp.]|nr:MAG: formyltetrahydrofolate deformylase [Propionibacterium sp.]
MHHWVISLVCPDQPGLIHAVSGACVAAGGNITESQQFSSPDSGRFFIRLEVEGIDDRQLITNAFRRVISEFDAEMTVDAVGRPKRTLVLASKAGHCLNDLLFRQRAGQLDIDICKVMANHPDLAGLAQFYDVDFEHHVVLPETKAEFEQRVMEVVNQYDIELVILARYMQILSPELCEFLNGKAINIHHSFLPGFKGANPYRQAHTRGVKLIGATAHFVTSDLDEGPIIEQNVVRVDHSKSVKQLVAIGQNQESITLSEAVKLFIEHRVLLDGSRTVIFK